MPNRKRLYVYCNAMMPQLHRQKPMNPVTALPSNQAPVQILRAGKKCPLEILKSSVLPLVLFI